MTFICTKIHTEAPRGPCENQPVLSVSLLPSSSPQPPPSGRAPSPGPPQTPGGEAEPCRRTRGWPAWLGPRGAGGVSLSVMDGPLAGAAVPICSPFGQTLYPQFNLSGPQITLRNQTGRWAQGSGLGEGPRAWGTEDTRSGSMPAPFPSMPTCCELQPSPWLRMACSTPSPARAALPSSLPGSFFPKRVQNPVLVPRPTLPLKSQGLLPLPSLVARCTSRPRGEVGLLHSFTLQMLSIPSQ